MKTLRNVTLALGLAICARAQFPDFTPPTPLIGAVMRNDTAGARQLLAQGADPNEGRFLGFPPVFFPVIHQNLDLLRAMAAKGSDVMAIDKSGSTALMWAAFNDIGKTEVVEELLKLGVDPNARNEKGETALAWAMQRGYTPVVAVLKKAGASDDAIIKESIGHSIPLLQKSGQQFVKVSGCASCHHQSLPQMAVALSRSHGVPVDEQAAQYQVKTVIAMFKPMRDLMLAGTEKIPDPAISVSYALVGLAAEHYRADAVTEAMAHLISTQQLPDGSFRTMPARPPIESSDFTATALSLRALQLYGKEPEQQVARAREWLRTARPVTTEDRAMQLLGLTWSDANPDIIREAARSLVSEQRADGGWAQLPALESDAYATGEALVALKWAGQATPSNVTYQRGVGFLLRTQLPDGSWLVRTRTFAFQPYKESGFPHGKDQWISAAGTSWATMALSLALPPQAEGSMAVSGGGSK